MADMPLPDETGTSFSKIFKTYYTDRLKCLSLYHKEFKRHEIVKRPLLLTFHSFSDRCGVLHWAHMIYQLAGKYRDRIDFLVENIEDAEFFCSTRTLLYPPRSGLDSNSPPLIYAVDSTNCVHYFTDTPTLDVLHKYCEKLVNSELVTVPDPARELVHATDIENFDIDLYSDMETDILLCFHQEHDTNNELLNLLISVAHHLRFENLRILHMYAGNSCEISRKFEVSNLPAIYFVRAIEKYKPIKCKITKFDLPNIIDFIAKHSTSELKYFNRRGDINTNFALHQELRQYFDLEKS